MVTSLGDVEAKFSLTPKDLFKDDPEGARKKISVYIYFLVENIVNLKNKIISVSPDNLILNYYFLCFNVELFTVSTYVTS